MMNKQSFKLVASIMCVFSLCYQSYGQIENNKNDFIYPLKLPINLNGNFGEARSRHFHGGVDFRANNVGAPVLAVADGYVCRISISPYGYGYALFVNHNNGYTSVYGHLSGFKSDIARFVKDIQYQNKSFSIDTTLNENVFHVKKGDVIAYSGNSGQSEGPHLHFEIRDTKTNKSLNVINTVYKITDNMPPEIFSLVIYPLSDYSTVDDKNIKKTFKALKSVGTTYKIENNEIPKVCGNIGFGISYVDKIDGNPFKFGIKDLKLYVNDTLYYHSEMKSIDFTKQRCKNSVFDYEYYLTKKQHVHKAFVEPNNDLEIFVTLKNNGIINLKENEKKKIKIQLYDFNDNTSFMEFVVVGGQIPENKMLEIANNQLSNQKYKWNKQNAISSEDFKVELDSATLFCDSYIEINKLKDRNFSSIYKVGEDVIALRKDIKVSFLLNEKAMNFKDKLVVSRIHNKIKSVIIPQINNQYASAFSNSFGEFYLDIDTVAPKITPKNIKDGSNLYNQKYIEVEISDNLSGIEKYDMYINDLWVLGEYEPRTKTVRYYFDERFDKSQKDYVFKTVVVDVVGNRAEYGCKFQIVKTT